MSLCYDQTNTLHDQAFHDLTGVTRSRFQDLLFIIQKQHKTLKSLQNYMLSLEDQLLLTLIHLQEGQPQSYVQDLFDVSASVVQSTLGRVEQWLHDCPEMAKPLKRRALQKEHQKKIKEKKRDPRYAPKKIHINFTCPTKEQSFLKDLMILLPNVSSSHILRMALWHLHKSRFDHKTLRDLMHYCS